MAVFAAVGVLCAGGGHKLKIVDHNKRQIVDAAALGVHLRDGDRGVVIHAQIGLRKRGRGNADLAPLVHGELSRCELLIIDKALIGKQTRNKLLL